MTKCTAIISKYSTDSTEYNNCNVSDIPFVVFYKQGCPYSEKAVNYLKEKNKAFRVYFIKDKDKDRLFKCLTESNSLPVNKINHRTFPTIFHNKQFVGGYSDLLQFLS